MGYLVQESNYLAHHGVKGMKWGIRKAANSFQKATTTVRKMNRNEKEMKSKLDKLTTGRNRIHSGDKERFNYRKQSLMTRIARDTVKQATLVFMSDMLAGNDYGSMSKEDKNKRIAAITKSAAVQVATKTALANRAAKNYDSSGNLKSGVKRGLVTPEDILQQVPNMARSASRVAKIGRATLHVKAEKVRQERSANEAKYKSKARAGLILESRIDDVIWKSEDGKTAWINNPRPGAKNITPRKDKK